MTASGRKQSTTRLISSPPAPVARSEGNGKEWTQHTGLDNGKEQEDGKGKRKKRRPRGRATDLHGECQACGLKINAQEYISVKE